LNDEYVQEFGFREFWIEGKKFFLNNSEIRLRPGVMQYGVTASKWLKAGYNFGEIWPENRARRGTADNDLRLVAEADRSGCPSAATCCSWRTG
jgi:beta-galactosidase